MVVLAGLTMLRFELTQKAKVFLLQRRVEQVIGREGETASLLKLARLILRCVNSVSPHVNSVVRRLRLIPTETFIRA